MSPARLEHTCSLASATRVRGPFLCYMAERVAEGVTFGLEQRPGSIEGCRPDVGQEHIPFSASCRRAFSVLPKSRFIPACTSGAFVNWTSA